MTIYETGYTERSPWAWSLALSRFSCNKRTRPQLTFNVFIHRGIVRSGEGVDFTFRIIQVLFIALRKTYLPPHQEKSRCPVSYTRISAQRRNISETSSQGNTNSWHLFNCAGLQCLNCAVAKNHWKEVWNWRKGNWKGRIKDGTMNLEVIKELERKLNQGGALPECQRGHRRKGNEEDKVGNFKPRLNVH